MGATRAVTQARGTIILPVKYPLFFPTLLAEGVLLTVRNTHFSIMLRNSSLASSHSRYPGYVLSHSAGSIADAFELSGTILGVTVLSFATTLPEKFVAIISGARGHGGIVVASTAGRNIFLLTLCLGITFIAGNQQELADSVMPFELLVTWVSSALLLPIVFFGSRQWIWCSVTGIIRCIHHSGVH